MGYRIIAASLLVFLGSAVSVAETYEDRIEVLEVQVPVNVVGPDGAAVRGLTLADFTVREGRQDREIVDFRAIDLEAIRPTPGRIEMDQVLPAEGRRHFLLVFDMTFSRPTSVLHARQAARELILRSLHPTDLVAVMTFSEQAGLQLLVTFTSDRAQLARAIDTMGRRDLLSGGLGDPLRFVIDAPSRAAESQGTQSSGLESGGSFLDSAHETLDSTARVIRREVERQERSYELGRIEIWIKHLGFLADALVEVGGRKHVVYFSEGFDDRLLMGQGVEHRMAEENLAAQVGRHLPVDTQAIYGDLSLLSEITRVLREFEKSGSSIHAVDISGVPARGRARSVHSTLARETGGTVVENTNHLEEGLGEILRASNVTYLLSFRAEGVRPDGSYHPIEVEVRGAPDATVLYRPGYHAPEPFAELHPLEKSLLAADALAAAAPRRELTLDLLAAPFQAGAGRSYVPVIVEIGGDSLLTDHQAKLLPLEIYAYASDSQGRMQDFFTQLLTLDAATARKALPGSGVKYYGHLELPPGEHLVRVMARNGSTGRTGVAAMPLAVPGFAAGEPALVGPFAPEVPGRWLLVREQNADGDERVVYPFTVNGEIFVPAVRPSFSPAEPARLCLVAYGLGDGGLTLSGEVLDADGDPVRDADLRLEERTVTGIDGYDKLLLDFRPPELDPGEYTLRLKVTEAERPLSPATAMRFRIGDRGPGPEPGI